MIQEENEFRIYYDGVLQQFFFRSVIPFHSEDEAKKSLDRFLGDPYKVHEIRKLIHHETLKMVDRENTHNQTDKNYQHCKICAETNRLLRELREIVVNHK